MSFNAPDDTGAYTFPSGTKNIIADDVTTLSSLISVGTISTGTWHGTIIDVSHGGSGVGTLTGILKGNGTSAFTAIVPLAGTKIYYASDTSGGTVDRKLTFIDGVLTAEV